MGRPFPRPWKKPGTIGTVLLQEAQKPGVERFVSIPTRSAIPVGKNGECGGAAELKPTGTTELAMEAAPPVEKDGTILAGWDCPATEPSDVSSSGALADSSQPHLVHCGLLGV
ncbi:uncharacterized protein THITE_2132287 [Thermothielavioides terrestris NRRL 8126]|uniref:Uncharacterized protein n=1 Tax=Thermothielavioides terrestris (strain ATCC 38088 / NRRL 8126) TaxID=578455 RepID=G2RDY5_THETT|nr:uncharacterized protein THITE_2132287 [Thermothielavioides terrestris NRRL 8126]AEO70868.1 hypothetical protein THITE_2132287 [Thermothielavioides terrestris NRRL 8126]